MFLTRDADCSVAPRLTDAPGTDRTGAGNFLATGNGLSPRLARGDGDENRVTSKISVLREIDEVSFDTRESLVNALTALSREFDWHAFTASDRLRHCAPAADVLIELFGE